MLMKSNHETRSRQKIRRHTQGSFERLSASSITEQVAEALFPELNQTTYAAQIERFDLFYQKFQQHESAEFDLIMSASYENFKRMYHSGVSSKAYSARW